MAICVNQRRFKCQRRRKKEKSVNPKIIYCKSAARFVTSNILQLLLYIKKEVNIKKKFDKSTNHLNKHHKSAECFIFNVHCPHLSFLGYIIKYTSRASCFVTDLCLTVYACAHMQPLVKQYPKLASHCPLCSKNSTAS